MQSVLYIGAIGDLSGIFDKIILYFSFPIFQTREKLKIPTYIGEIISSQRLHITRNPLVIFKDALFENSLNSFVSVGVFHMPLIQILHRDIRLLLRV